MGLVDKAYQRFTRFPKPYMELLDRIHHHLIPRTYVEIGIRNGRSMRLAVPGTRAVGIDPAPRIDGELSADCSVYEMTSDDFFAEHDLTRSLDNLPLDLAFIDGMHQFEFALRDFMNLERFANLGTTVLVHDCYPVDEATSAREETKPIWSGDVWKLVLCLKDARPDLAISVVDAGPTGLGIIRGCDPESRVLHERYEDLLGRYLEMPYGVLDQDKAGTLNRVPNEWDTVAGLLPERPFRKYPLRTLKMRRAVRGASHSARRRGSKILARS